MHAPPPASTTLFVSSFRIYPSSLSLSFSHIHIAFLHALKHRIRQRLRFLLPITLHPNPNRPRPHHHHLGEIVRSLVQMHLHIIRQRVRNRRRRRRSAFKTRSKKSIHLRQRFGSESEAAFLHIPNDILHRIRPPVATICEYVTKDGRVLGNWIFWMLATTPSTVCFLIKHGAVTWISFDFSFSLSSWLR